MLKSTQTTFRHTHMEQGKAKATSNHDNNVNAHAHNPMPESDVFAAVVSGVMGGGVVWYSIV